MNHKDQVKWRAKFMMLAHRVMSINLSGKAELTMELRPWGAPSTAVTIHLWRGMTTPDPEILHTWSIREWNFKDSEHFGQIVRDLGWIEKDGVDSFLWIEKCRKEMGGLHVQF